MTLPQAEEAGLEITTSDLHLTGLISEDAYGATRTGTFSVEIFCLNRRPAPAGKASFNFSPRRNRTTRPPDTTANKSGRFQTRGGSPATFIASRAMCLVDSRIRPATATQHE